MNDIEMHMECFFFPSFPKSPACFRGAGVRGHDHAGVWGIRPRIDMNRIEHTLIITLRPQRESDEQIESSWSRCTHTSTLIN
mmetsp:Transcript_40220/g.114693  ORF Transcript_40220/g.114693 Transcript_40220/m.114693 type:complete len:82 (+) Transcript_40220:876-1121(+)